MAVKIIAVGKLKEKYFREACSEYEKRLSAFTKVTVEELDAVRLPDDPSQTEIARALEAEGAKIAEKIPAGSFTAVMTPEGRRFSSEGFAKVLNEAALSGKSTLVFVIGGSYGLSEKVKATADIRISMSDMTFPHRLFRVMLLEQIYRAFTITANKRYHK